MRLGLNQSARMEQRLVQSPQMIQAMQILQLSSMDLAERIEQELIENPLLEVSETSDSDDSSRDEAESETSELDNMVEVLERYERDFGDGRVRASGSEEGDRKMEAMQNTASQHRSLSDDLIEQLAILDLGERERELALFLVYSLDEHGFLPDALEELAEECGATPEELGFILEELRRVSHPGLGAQDLRECLLLQLEAHGMQDALENKIVADHLEDLTTNRLPRIARATGATLDDVKDAIDTIRHLDPYPGEDYGHEPVSAITPDVLVLERHADVEDAEPGAPKYEIKLTRDRMPSLQVSTSYRRMLEGTKKGDSVQQWVKRRLEAARWFIDAVHQRRSTMQKVAEVIFREQEDFLEQGVMGLKPLRMQEVADEAGVHISTVSRAVAGKYAQTPQGIHPLKYFFTSGTTDATGGVASQTSIKQRIAELIEAEDPKQPHSDEELSSLLEESDGIKIARRTVTKYRKALGLPASSQRKQY